MIRVGALVHGLWLAQNTLKIWEAAYLLVLIVVLLVLLLFRRRKKKKTLRISWAKNTARGERFLLGLICTWFWLNVNRYTCFWHVSFFLPSSEGLKNNKTLICVLIGWLVWVATDYFVIAVSCRCNRRCVQCSMIITSHTLPEK